MHRTIILVAVATLISAALAAAAPAEAAAPVVVEKTDRSDPLVRHWEDFYDCGDFLVTADFFVVRTITEHYDREGNLVRTVFNIHFTGTLSNPESGKSVSDRGTFRIVFDEASGTETITGGLRHVTVRGQGLVIAETGRTVFGAEGVLSEAGHKSDSRGETAELCAALR